MKSLSATNVSVVDAGLTPGSVAGDGPPGDRAGRVLGAHDLTLEITFGNVAQRLQNLELFVANPVGLEGDRRLHGRQAQDLEQVVLDHVAQAARLLEVAAAPLDADRLRPGDLHVIDEVVVPERLEDPVGEPEHQQVLDRLFSQVMIDAVDLLLVEDLVDLAVEGAGRLQVDAERLLDDHPRERLAGRRLGRQLGLAEAADHRRERRGGRRQIEDPVAGEPQRLLDLPEAHLQPLE
jgi:hypothetical protein